MYDPALWVVGGETLPIFCLRNFVANERVLNFRVFISVFDLQLRNLLGATHI